MNLQDIDALFPQKNKETYFLSAGITLTPTSVLAAERAYLQMVEDSGQLAAELYYMPHLQQLRENLAQLMHAADPAEIAFTQHTAEGTCIIANGLDWKPGDLIMSLNKEYPSTIYPWMNVAKRFNLRLELLEEKEGRVDEAEIARAIREKRPRLFAISAVEWCSGYRFDLQVIGEACREAGTFFFVDGAQALGFCEVDVQACHVSALASSGWKWLCGPHGSGCFYLRKDLLETITPTFVGSNSVVNALDYLDYNLTFLPDMRRFEYSTRNIYGHVGLNAATRFLLDVGLENLCNHVFPIQDYAIEQLKALGCEVRGGGPVEKRSGIMAFRIPGQDSLALSKKMAAESGLLAPERDGFIRLSFHLYSTTAGVDKLIEYLRTVVKN
jgi:selenocysteine lyase/cysteine desulfurase